MSKSFAPEKKRSWNFGFEFNDLTETHDFRWRKVGSSYICLHVQFDLETTQAQ